jgi:hypothetical protein
VLLYHRFGRFACRCCNSITFQSRTEGARYRALSRANRIKAKLGGQTGMFHPFPTKPVRMRWTTYARLAAQYIALADIATAEMEATLSKMWGRTRGIAS